MSEVRIKAKKISDLNQNTAFDFETKGNETFLIVAYKPENGQPQNFKMSINTIIDKLKISMAMSNDEFKQQLLAVLEQYQEIRNSLESPSVLEWAQEHGFTGDDEELWDMFKNGNNGSGEGGETGPVNPDTTKYLFSYVSENQDGLIIKDNVTKEIIGVNISNLKALNYTQETIGIVPKENKNGYSFCLKDYSTTYESSYVWDERVENGRVWIILPSKFYNISQNVFVDENGKKWKYIDSAFKGTVSLAIDPIILSNFYEDEDYIMICYSQEGQVDEQYFKKI